MARKGNDKKKMAGLSGEQRKANDRRKAKEDARFERILAGAGQVVLTAEEKKQAQGRLETVAGKYGIVMQETGIERQARRVAERKEAERLERLERQASEQARRLEQRLAREAELCRATAAGVSVAELRQIENIDQRSLRELWLNEEVAQEKAVAEASVAEATEARLAVRRQEKAKALQGRLTASERAQAQAQAFREEKETEHRAKVEARRPKNLRPSPNLTAKAGAMVPSLYNHLLIATARERANR